MIPRYCYTLMFYLMFSSSLTSSIYATPTSSISTTTSSTSSLHESENKCYFRSGRKVLSGECIAKNECCLGGSTAVAQGLCPNKDNSVCCFSKDICKQQHNMRVVEDNHNNHDNKPWKSILHRVLKRSPKRDLKSSSVRATIHINEMTEPMKEVAVNLAVVGFQKHKEFNDVAEYICHELDEKYAKNDENWSCLVGSNFGYSVPYKAGKYIEFFLGSVRVLLFVSE